MSWNPHSRSAPAPWYLLVWRALWLIPVELFGSLCLLALLIGFGPRAMRDVERALKGK